MDGWNLVRDWENELCREVIKLPDLQRMIESFSYPRWNRLSLASGTLNVLRKRMYATSLYRYDVCISGDSSGKILFSSRRPRDLWHCILFACLLSRRNYCNLFCDCNSGGSFGEVFAHRGCFPLLFWIVVGLGHEIEDYRWSVTVATVL